MATYSGKVVSATVKTGEYSDEHLPTGGYAFTVRFDSGWETVIGRYGAVLSERTWDGS